MADGDTIEVRDLSFGIVHSPNDQHGINFLPGKMTLNEIEKQAILAALDMTHWVQKDAAAVLGVSPRVLNYKIKSHHLTHTSWLRHKPPPQ